MKRLLNLLLTLLIVTAATAATVNRQQAREAAAKFMQLKGKQIDATSQQGNKAPAADQPLYVFNAANDGGFVVVSGDDRTDAILGYTEQGSYDEDNLPPALKEWLSQMTIEIEALQQMPAEGRAASAPKAEPQQVTIHQAIPPLIKTEWNQGNTYKQQNYNTDGIYNFKLPKDGSYYYPCTGCVAVCGAQIMYYFKCPQGQTTDVPGYPNENPNVNTSNGLPATTFQWDKMKTSYNSSSDAYSEAAEAVAELMLYAGYAAKMRYAVGGSSANQMALASGMAEYFGYDPYSLAYIKRSEHSIAEWDELMYKEIAEGRPIIYDGAQAADGSNGHAFLCDGYDGAGLYHFNWGWGGDSNGYFKLQATNPDGPDDYPGYVFNNSAVIGIRPFNGIVPDDLDPNGDDEWEDPVIEGLVASVDFNGIEGTTVSLGMWNKNEEECGFGFGIGELLDDGTIKEFDYKFEYSKNTILKKNYGWGERLFDFSDNKQKLENGTHKLVPVSLLNGETEWKRCRPADMWFEVTVSDDSMDIVRHPVYDIQINKFELATPGAPDAYQRVVVNITNKGDNTTKTYYIYVDGVWAGFSDSRRTLKIAAGNTKEFLLLTKIMSEGKHTVTLREGYEGPVVAEFEADIKVDLAATDFRVVSDLKFAGTPLPIDVTVSNKAGDYTLPLYLFASTSENSIGSRVYMAGTGIPNGGSEDVRFYFKPNYGGTWYLSVATDQYGNRVIGSGSVDIDDAPSGTVTLQRVSSTWTSLPNGQAEYVVTYKNTSETTYYRNVRVHLYRKPEAEGNWPHHGSNTSDPIVLEPEQEITLTFNFTELEDSAEYGIYPQYYSTYTSTNYTDLYQYVNSETHTYTAPAVEPDPDPIPGDTSGDGLLTAEDVTPLIEYLTGKRSELPANADLNEDTKVDIIDIVTLISKIIELQSKKKKKSVTSVTLP